METHHVYIIGSSLEEERPEIDFQLSDNQIDWTRIGAILDGTRDVSGYQPPHFVVHSRTASEWDFYRCAGTLGVISRRAVEVLAPYCSECFEFLDAFVNEEPFFLIRQIGEINCLDHERTIGKMFPHDQSRFMRIDRYSFDKSRLADPLMFLPDGDNSRIFGTDSIKRLIEAHHLRGFRIVDAEHEPVGGGT